MAHFLIRASCFRLKAKEDWSARVKQPQSSANSRTNLILQLRQSRPIHRDPNRQAAVSPLV